jgi:hypothetical protein
LSGPFGLAGHVGTLTDPDQAGAIDHHDADTGPIGQLLHPDLAILVN